MTSATDVVIAGAGMGGLAAAILLSARGLSVHVVEAAASPGGKMRQVEAGGRHFDAGPTVLTMPWVFEKLFADAGSSIASELELVPSEIIARHYWTGGAGLDLHADISASADAIGEFAGPADAAGYRRFARDSGRIYETLRDSYIDARRPSPIGLARRIGLGNLPDMLALRPFSTLMGALSGYFSDPRLQQLFGRYATYCGSSPYASPATLMLIAHVEREGVWRAKGGMHALARAMAAMAARKGATFTYGERIVAISMRAGRVSGVTTDAGRDISCGRLIHAGDPAALATMIPGSGLRPLDRAKRSVSAMVACAVAKPEGAPLAHHTVIFGDDYREEFDAVFRRSEAPADPTVYLCAQDRADDGRLGSGCEQGGERIYALINMPADGDRHRYGTDEVERCLARMDRRLALAGVKLNRTPGALTVTMPDTFATLFPGSGGALYGLPSHGWMASFRRRGSRTVIPGLYLAGAGVHPGAGVPMAALSGRRAAESLLADLASTCRSRPAAMPGGISTASAIAAGSRSV